MTGDDVLIDKVTVFLDGIISVIKSRWGYLEIKFRDRLFMLSHLTVHTAQEDVMLSNLHRWAMIRTDDCLSEINSRYTIE